MILYNSSYEFVGISDSYIKRLNFPSFNALKYRIGDDFANLFIEKKGFLYNFQYLSWIDFILQNMDKAQAILKGGDNSYYKVTFSIEPYYFMNSSEKGYFLLIETMTEYEMDSFYIDESSFHKPENEDGLSYSSDEDEYYISNEENLSENEHSFESSFDDSKTYSFEEKQVEKPKPTKEVPQIETNELFFENSLEESLDKTGSSLKNNESPQEVQVPENSSLQKSEPVGKKALQSPEEFLKSFDTNQSEDNLQSSEQSSSTNIENIDSSLSEGTTSLANTKQHISYPLKQINIDKIAENETDIDTISGDKFSKTFSSDLYVIDEVSKELGMRKSTLSDFLIDFIHHINHLKPYIYKSLEENKIKDVKNAIFMLKGLSSNLRIIDIYEILDKIYSSYYGEASELLKDINSIYDKVTVLNKQIKNSGEATLNFESTEVRPFVSTINSSTLPDILFQDIINSFLRLFDSSKEKIEKSLNPDSIEELTPIIKELDNISEPLNIDDINLPINRILNNINQRDIEFDKLVVDWIDLSNFVEKLR